MDNRTTLEAERPAKAAKAAKKPAPLAKKESERERERVFDAFRRWGYYEATLDPLGVFQPLKHPDLELTGEAAGEARRIYCGNVGAEFMHLPEPERRRWIQERIEGPQEAVDQKKILERLVRAELFEQVLQARYLGTKRFSLEGVTSLIPLLDSILDTAGHLRRGGLRHGHEPSRAIECNGSCRVQSAGTKWYQDLRMSTRAACWARAT